MKKIKSIAIVGLALLVLGFSSCSKEFLERQPTTAVSSDLALTSVTNVQSATVGLMAYFATAAYTGRNLPVIGDLITDNLTTKAGNSGHLLDVEMWNISSSLSEIGVFWNGSYQIVSAAVKVIQACDNLSETARDSEKKTLDKCKASALTIKTFAEYILTQYYCLPYSAAGRTRGNVIIGTTPSDMNGIILVNAPISVNDAKDYTTTPLVISSLEETYTHMHNQLAEAIRLYEASGSPDFANSAYFPSTCMAYTMQARLFLEQAKYDSAIAAADNALGHLVTTAKRDLVDEQQAFIEQYRTISAPTQEDILTVNFTTSDNLSANSINNMFGSYGCMVSKSVRDLCKDDDIRKALYLTSASDDKLEIFSSCGKYPNENYINNVPVLRIPELYLIKAEASAQKYNSLEDLVFQEAMMATLGTRDTSIHTYDDLRNRYFTSADKTALDYVLDERRREFAGEGHRWFDLRRTQKTLSRATGSAKNDCRMAFTNYPIGIFAFPIPESETNTGAWHDYKLGTGSRGQNEAWEANGDSWTSKFGLPIPDGDYTN